MKLWLREENLLQTTEVEILPLLKLTLIMRKRSIPRAARTWRQRSIWKNKDHAISWVLEVTSYLKPSPASPLYKEDLLMAQLFNQCWRQKYVFWFLKFTWVTWPECWIPQSASLVKVYFFCRFQLHFMHGSQDSRGCTTPKLLHV